MNEFKSFTKHYPTKDLMTLLNNVMEDTESEMASFSFGLSITSGKTHSLSSCIDEISLTLIKGEKIAYGSREENCETEKTMEPLRYDGVHFYDKDSNIIKNLENFQFLFQSVNLKMSGDKIKKSQYDVNLDAYEMEYTVTEDLGKEIIQNNYPEILATYKSESFKIYRRYTTTLSLIFQSGDSFYSYFEATYLEQNRENTSKAKENYEKGFIENE